MTRSRRRSGPRPWGLLVLAVAIALLAVGGHGAGAFTTGAVDRSSTVDVTNDTAGVYGIDTATAVHVNATEPLVTLTNNFGRDVTVTVELRSDSTGKGDLVVGGTTYGDRVSFGLAAGDSRTVDVAVANDSTLAGETVYFHARASASGLYVTANDRGVPIQS